MKNLTEAVKVDDFFIACGDGEFPLSMKDVNGGAPPFIPYIDNRSLPLLMKSMEDYA